MAAVAAGVCLQHVAFRRKLEPRFLLRFLASFTLPKWLIRRQDALVCVGEGGGPYWSFRADRSATRHVLKTDG